jgi:hypothetical protein
LKLEAAQEKKKEKKADKSFDKLGNKFSFSEETANFLKILLKKDRTPYILLAMFPITCAVTRPRSH